jgi:hypothetical protein
MKAKWLARRRHHPCQTNGSGSTVSAGRTHNEDLNEILSRLAGIHHTGLLQLRLSSPISECLRYVNSGSLGCRRSGSP